jgi:hypothetical protein
MASAANSVVAELRSRQICVQGEEFDLRKLPELCNDSACFRRYKDDIQECGIAPRKLSHTLGNAVIFLKIAVFSFIACGEYRAENVIYNAWFNTTKLLGQIETAFLRMKIGVADSLQSIYQGYLYAWDGNGQFANDRFRFASDKLTELRGILPGLLANVDVILNDLKRLRDKYAFQREAVQTEFDTKVNRLKTRKRKFTRRKREENTASRRRATGLEANIEQMQAQSKIAQWLHGTENTIQQCRREKEQLEAELAVNIQTYNAIIDRLARQCEKESDDDTTVRAIHAAINAVGHVQAGLLQCQTFLDGVIEQYKRALGRPVVMEPSRGQTIRDVITSDSFKMDIVLSYCL